MNKHYLNLILNDKMTWQEFSELAKEFNTSLCACQSQLQQINKSTVAYNFKYAKYEEIRMITKDIISNNSLSIEQWKSGSHESPMLITRIKHNNGYEEEYETPMIFDKERSSKLHPEQEDGKSITYYKRYMYCSILGIATKEEDVDDIKPKQSETTDKYPVCPKCNKDLVEKQGKYGPFYCCPGYPECKYILKN